MDDLTFLGKKDAIEAKRLWDFLTENVVADVEVKKDATRSDPGNG